MNGIYHHVSSLHTFLCTCRSILGLVSHFAINVVVSSRWYREGLASKYFVHCRIWWHDFVNGLWSSRYKTAYAILPFNDTGLNIWQPLCGFFLSRIFQSVSQYFFSNNSYTYLCSAGFRNLLSVLNIFPLENGSHIFTSISKMTDTWTRAWNQAFHNKNIYWQYHIRGCAKVQWDPTYIYI